MVEPVSGKMASLAGLGGLSSAGGREPIGTGAAKAAADTRGAAIAPGDTSLVSEGRAAARSMAAEPPVDSSRVAMLREAIAAGRYTPDPDRIADAMIRSEPGLAGN